MASASTVPAKRPRTDSREGEQDLPGLITFIRSDLWWEDGNIIIEAETTRFRVYKGLLATQSEIFRDMFSIPQPPSDQEDLVEGCPVVRVSDSAEDWTYILQALLERRYVTLPVQPIPFAVVAAFLRLGLKYDIALLKKEAITRLVHDFPTSLEAYGAVGDDQRMIAVSKDQDFYERCARAINLARECHCVDFMLPSSFYGVISHPDFHTTTQPLSPEDRMVGVSGWSNAVKGQEADTMRWLLYKDDLQTSQLYQGCKSPDRCHETRNHFLRAIFIPIPRIYGLCRWEDWAVISQFVCESCFAAAQRSHNEGRERFWQKLPTFFGLPGWDELLREH